MSDVVSKAEFARLVGVDRSRVAQWIAAGVISGEALVREGRAERINVEEARRQLGRRLDFDQRISGSRAGSSDTLEAIQREKLEALVMANEKARIEADARAGRFILASDAKIEMGRIATRMAAGFEGALAELADAVAGATGAPRRDVLHALRTAWRASRARLSGLEGEAAMAEPELVEAAQ